MEILPVVGAIAGAEINANMIPFDLSREYSSERHMTLLRHLSSHVAKCS